jgi:hypothetical protein
MTMDQLKTVAGTFLATPEKALGSSLVIAVVSGIGWMISRFFGSRADRKRQQILWQLEFIQKQLQELYGPLQFLLVEGEGTLRVLLSQLGRNYVFDEQDRISESDLRTWMFWAESDLMPRNRQIRELLATKAHLIDGRELRASYQEFLLHYSSWEIAHKRWKEQDVSYSWHSQINWPREFAIDVSNSFTSLKRQHANLLGQLTAHLLRKS